MASVLHGCSASVKRLGLGGGSGLLDPWVAVVLTHRMQQWRLIQREKMKDEDKEQKPDNQEDDNEELTDTEKLFYQMIWGKVWDEEYPPENKKEAD